MYEVGDVIVNKNFRKERYTIMGICPERFSILVEAFPDVVDISKSYYIGIDTLYEQWDYDYIYYRKLKLQKICSKLEIG